MAFTYVSGLVHRDFRLSSRTWKQSSRSYWDASLFSLWNYKGSSFKLGYSLCCFCRYLQPSCLFVCDPDKGVVNVEVSFSAIKAQYFPFFSSQGDVCFPDSISGLTCGRRLKENLMLLCRGGAY